MRSKLVLTLVLMWVAAGDASLEPAGAGARGKKKKIALFIYFADLVIKKIFILKLFYAFVFWVVIHKAGYFLSWFVSYFKEKTHHHVEPEYHFDHSPHHHEEYSSPYGGYGPYRRKTYSRRR